MRIPFRKSKYETPEQIEQELDAMTDRREARRKTNRLAAKDGFAYHEATEGPPNAVDVALWLVNLPRVVYADKEYTVTGWKGGFMYCLSRPKLTDPVIADIRRCTPVEEAPPERLGGAS